MIIHGKLVAIGSTTFRINVFLSEAWSPASMYNAMRPMTNAMSGGCTAAVNIARRRTASAASTQPKIKMIL